MLTSYRNTSSGGLQLQPFEGIALKDFVWIDLLEPTQEEEHAVEAALGISIPTRDEMHEIEQSSRLYSDQGALYVTATILSKTDTEEPESHAISFVLSVHGLITIRYATPKSFQLVAERLCRPSSSSVPAIRGIDIFLTLSDAVVDRLADVVEEVGHRLDQLGRGLFRPSLKDKQSRDAAKPDYDATLREIGVMADIISKTRESLGSISRMHNYVLQHGGIARDATEHARLHELLGDISPLNDHANFLSNKVSFLLDATLGMIGMEQNGTIKILSVASVVFLPPTLIASIYGMNFRHIPELTAPYGYPFALCVMGLAAWLPYLYFKRKKWL